MTVAGPTAGARSIVLFVGVGSSARPAGLATMRTLNPGLTHSAFSWKTKLPSMLVWSTVFFTVAGPVIVSFASNAPAPSVNVIRTDGEGAVSAVVLTMARTGTARFPVNAKPASPVCRTTGSSQSTLSMLKSVPGADGRTGTAGAAGSVAGGAAGVSPGSIGVVPTTPVPLPDSVTGSVPPAAGGVGIVCGACDPPPPQAARRDIAASSGMHRTNFIGTHSKREHV